MGQVRGWDKTKKEYIIVIRPAIVEKYNTFMGGVDLMNSLTALYKQNMKSKNLVNKVL